MANPYPWYPWYANDYAAATAHLSDPADLYYRRLLDHYYKTRRPLPDDDGAWANICRAHSEAMKQLVPLVVEEFFVLESDGWHNRRADREIAKMVEKSAKRSRAGKASAQQRATSNPTHEPTPVEHVFTQSQSQSQPESKPPKKEREKRADARGAHSVYQIEESRRGSSAA